jgi:hypothetical protein
VDRRALTLELSEALGRHPTDAEVRSALRRQQDAEARDRQARRDAARIVLLGLQELQARGELGELLRALQLDAND